jgi:DNA primase
MGLISPATIDRILDAARIEEVVGEFVTLKRSGGSFRGLSPFTQEKTPSFYVVPSKGIFKCFSSGKGGSVVTFLMEHEQLSYPDALRWLAKKYNVEIEEEESTPEQDAVRDRRESMFSVNAFALKQFSEWMWNDDHGRAVGLAYVRERGFTEETIKKFELGFHLEGRDTFAKAALKAGYQSEFLEATGLCIKRESGDLVDRFWGRAMFPIHSLSGRVVGFGGRVLRSDAKTAKYLNSPESEIYHKSQVLYGLFQAKQAISRANKVYLVEGYTDVISMHQGGVHNVVSSSGTALTLDQIRLIKRLTEHVTLLYDGDKAGIRASFRGIDLLLEEGLYVRAVPLPVGEDPDSLARSMDSEALNTYLTEHEVDFIQFKVEALTDEGQAQDPIRRAEVVRDVVQSVAKIPNAILREVYLRDSAQRLGIEERSLYAEMERIRGAELKNASQRRPDRDPYEDPNPPEMHVQRPQAPRPLAVEEALIKVLLQHGSERVKWLGPDGLEHEDAAAALILDDVSGDELEFTHPTYQRMFTEMLAVWHAEERILGPEHFVRHEDPSMAATAAECLTERHQLADWSRKSIYVGAVEEQLSSHVHECLLRFKEYRLEDRIKELIVELGALTDEVERQAKMTDFMNIQAMRNALRAELQRVV